MSQAAEAVLRRRLEDLERELSDGRQWAAKIQSITDRLPALLAYTDPSGRYVHANARYAAWLGVTPEEMVGRPVGEVLTRALGEEYWNHVRPGFERSLAGEDVVLEAEGRYLNGIRFVEVHYAPDCDDQGRLQGVVVLVIDITDRKLAESELQHRGRLLDQAMEPVFTWELGGAITYWNRASEELYGYTAAEAIGRVSHELLRTRHPVSVPYLEQTLVERGLWTGELRHTAKDGRELLVDSIHRLVEYRSKRLVVESNRNLTDKRRSEERLRRAIAAANVAVWEADLTAGTLEFSENLEELYGLTPGEARSIGDLRRCLVPEDVVEMDCRFQQAIDTHRQAIATVRVRRDGGEHRWLYIQAQPFYDDEGRPIRMAAAAVDITEQRVAQEELQMLAATLERRVERRTRELEEAVRELESFSYSVSHDLRAPLRSIEGFGEMLLRDYAERPLDEQGRDYLRRMSRAAVRMGALIDDLLNLSRINRAALEKRVVDLSAKAEEITEGLRAAQPGRQVQIRIQPGMRAVADPGLMRVVLANLLGNAWKYTGRRENAEIDFEASIEGGERVYRVRDNGAGFDMRHAERLFGAFQRLHRASEFEGAGIGLATVQRIVHRHGGRIWAQAAPGEGATFSFTLGSDDVP